MTLFNQSDINAFRASEQRHEQDNRINQLARELDIPANDLRTALVAYAWRLADDPTGYVTPTTP